jgi:hypothetical protein
MDFTHYRHHFFADRTGRNNKWRDCSRVASKLVIEIFNSLVEQEAEEGELKFSVEDMEKALKDLYEVLDEKVWPLESDDWPAGGSTAAQGTAAITLDEEDLVSEEELEEYIEEHIRDHATHKKYKKLSEKQLEHLTEFKYAARTAARREDEEFSKYYYPFSMEEDDDDFYRCEGIVDLEDHEELSEEQRVEDEVLNSEEGDDSGDDAEDSSYEPQEEESLSAQEIEEREENMSEEPELEGEEAEALKEANNMLFSDSEDDDMSTDEPEFL